ncbi:MAG: NAD-dependent epimerase/dehydratase family protein [Thermomicrobiales bacterium]
MLETVTQLEDALTAPPPALVRDLDSLDGDLLILGCSGKMGPTLARLAHRALTEAGGGRRVLAVSRFTDATARNQLDEAGIITIAADLLDRQQVSGLPDASNVVYMVGTKFGTTGEAHQTWATNVLAPAIALERYATSRFVVFSSGNVYPFTPVTSGGATECVSPEPVGEYAQSCLARERVFEYYAAQAGTHTTIFRLNYAVELRYGVVCDVGLAVQQEQEIDLAMGNANVIWQGDANAFALRALTLARNPPKILNVTGPETISIRWLAEQFGERLGKKPRFAGEEAPSALLSNAAEAFRLLGYPETPLARVIDWTAHWIKIGGPALDKPTHFQEREGRF